MGNKYRIFCNTENNWVETWSVSVPTECPNNSEHIIDTTSIVITGCVRPDHIHLNFGSDTKYYYQCETGEWELISKFYFNGTNVLGNVHNCQLIASVLNSEYPATYRLYDVTNDNVICTWTVNSEEFDTYIETVLENIPENGATLEIHGKTTDNDFDHVSRAASFMMEFTT